MLYVTKLFQRMPLPFTNKKNEGIIGTFPFNAQEGRGMQIISSNAPTMPTSTGGSKRFEKKGPKRATAGLEYGTGLDK